MLYKEIEELYKRQSPYNKIKIKIFWLFIGIVFFLFLFNIINKYLLMLVVVIVSIILIKKIYEKELNTKLYFKFNKIKSQEKPLNQIIYKKEIEIFQNYLRENKIENFRVIKLIIEHYRNLVKPKIVSDNFWSIMAIVISVLLAFITKDGFDFKSFEKALPYLLSYIFIIIMILFSIKQFSGIKTFLKGEEGMHERLEIIFTDLYISKFKEKNFSNKKKNIKLKYNKHIK